MGCGGSKGEASGPPPETTDNPRKSFADGRMSESLPPEPMGPLSQEEILSRHFGSPAAENFELVEADGTHELTLRYAALSQRGYYPDDLHKANQDSFVVHRAFGDVEGHIFFGVFDGHGKTGDLCSRFVRDRICDEMSKQLKKRVNKKGVPNVKQSLRHTFLKIKCVVPTLFGRRALCSRGSRTARRRRALPPPRTARRRRRAPAAHSATRWLVTIAPAAASCIRTSTLTIGSRARRPSSATSAAPS